MSDSLVSQLTAGSNDSSAAGDADCQRTSTITLSLTEYSSLTSRLAAAEETARHLAEQLQHSLNDVEKMRLLLIFTERCYAERGIAVVYRPSVCQ